MSETAGGARASALLSTAAGPDARWEGHADATPGLVRDHAHMVAGKGRNARRENATEWHGHQPRPFLGEPGLSEVASTVLA